MSIKKIIITGHRGFIGSNMCNLLAQYNYEIYGIDALLKGSNNFDTPGRKKIIKEYLYNLSDDKLYDELINDFKSWDDVCIIHFAAYSHVDDSISSPNVIIRENICSTYRIAEFCAKNNIPFFNISTDEVYGSLRLNEKGFKDTDEADPRNPYSASKACNEVLINSLKHQYPNWKVIQTRCVNNFGPYQDPTKLIPVCIFNILNNKKIPVYGQGLQRRTWIPVDIHNKVVLGLLEKIFNNTNWVNINHLYNIGSDDEYSNIELIQMICNIMDKKINDVVNYIPDPRGHSHDYRYHLQYKHIEDKFKDLYDYSFENKLEETIKFYTQNKDNFLKWVL